MNRPGRIALLSLLTAGLLMIGGMLALQSASVAFAQAAATQTPTAFPPSGARGSPAPATGTQTNTGVEVWDQFCVAKVPYTLLALPTNASFDIKPPQGPLPTAMPGYTVADQIACDSVGTFRDKQVVICRGPQLYAFSLQISGSGSSQEFKVPLKECALPQSTNPAHTP